MLFCLSCKFNPHLSFHSRGKKTLVAIFHRLLKLARERRGRPYRILLNDICLRLLKWKGNTDTQHIFTFRTIQREYAMRYEFSDFLAEFIIELVNTVRI